MPISNMLPYATAQVGADTVRASIPDLFQRNAAILADSSGQYTHEQRVAAFQYITANWGALQSSSPSDKIAVNSGLGVSLSAEAAKPAVTVTLSDSAKAALQAANGATS